MEVSKEKLINSISVLISENVWSSDPNNTEKVKKAKNAFEKRIIGFRAEIEFPALLEKRKHLNRTIFNGGTFLPTDKEGEAFDKSSIHYIVDSKPHTNYEEVFSTISKSEVKKHFYFKILNSGQIIDSINGSVYIPNLETFSWNIERKKFEQVPISEFLKNFTKKKNFNKPSQELNNTVVSNDVLKDFSKDELLNLLSNRVILDYYIGYNYVRGIPVDIDLIVKKNGKFSFLEIKEKDLSKRKPNGFGMDTRRLESMTSFANPLHIPYFYIVREIDNQKDRNFINWHYIDVNYFADLVTEYKTINGGTGMAVLGKNHPTKVCPKEKFTTIDFNISS
ncbi:MAG: hypothetical protein CMP67_02370 [Flavobacteriales bacterium]|nr:hypothetical protein [Flavobacteriales bacterium]|tara:strand:- start:1768 stop:2775 length:1008 start_codon:yes stop_codon:yes gene_type:complete